ncbi:MAG: hypothetical protein IKD99_03290 [Erysipelotrichaceae bacterium]|nr:hypothetical protein [Erysipelotrichaceae bacterium]MBR2745727.1 hypothetical protein [Erysipelotrichaceae bacterium]
MRIEVSTPELPIPVKLIFPTSVLRSRWIWRLALKYTDNRQKETVMNYRNMISESTSVLEEYVRKFGHFNLVEVEEKDGTKVLIRI